jgi:hypothetical protein
MNKQALSEMGHFTGTEGYHRLNPFPLYLTDGTLHLAQNADCFWLFTEIAAAQHLSIIKNDERLQGIQFWHLRLNPQPPRHEPFTLGAVLDSQREPTPMATLVCERDTDDVAWEKPIEFTDFPFDVLTKPTIWVAPTSFDGTRTVWVAYLPSEH